MCLYYMNHIKSYIKATIYVSEFMLIPFHPPDIKCKKLNAKNLYLEGVSFSYFAKVTLDHRIVEEGGGG